MSAKIRETTYFGHHALPQQQQDALKKAIRVERISIFVKLLAVSTVFSVSGSSQAMKANWIEDALELLPPLAFLVAIRFANRKPSPRHPYGFHRAIGVGHLVASVALLAMGTYLLIDSAVGLISGDRPPIGLIELFGTPIWAGWLMIAVSTIVVIPSMIIGRINWKLAPILHNKVLYADGDMNKADWMTGLATAVGILGVGFGLWWFDAAVAILISLGIVSDGLKNLRGCLAGLIDARATTTDSKQPHELIAEVRDILLKLNWVAAADVRMRDQGQVFYTEAFVVPQRGHTPSLEELENTRNKLSAMDWKLHDLVLIPTAELPEEALPQINDAEE